MTEKCAICDAPAFGSINTQGFCSEHVGEVIADAMRAAKQAQSALAKTLGTRTAERFEELAENSMDALENRLNEADARREAEEAA